MNSSKQIVEIDTAVNALDEMMDYHLKQKAALQNQLLSLHRRIRYREQAIQSLSFKRKEALNFTLPLEITTP